MCFFESLLREIRPKLLLFSLICDTDMCSGLNKAKSLSDAAKSSDYFYIVRNQNDPQVAVISINFPEIN